MDDCVWLVMDTNGPVKLYNIKGDADRFVEFWKKSQKRRKVWILKMQLIRGY